MNEYKKLENLMQILDRTHILYICMVFHRISCTTGIQQHSFLFISQRKRSISQNFASFSHSKNATFEGMSRRASERNLLKYLGNLICSKNF